MAQTEKTPTKAALDALLPAMRTLANTTPYGFARVSTGSGESPEVTIELPLPSGSGVTVFAHIAYGSEWKVGASGASWKLTDADSIRTTAMVLGVAHALAALLASLAD